MTSNRLYRFLGKLMDFKSFKLGLLLYCRFLHPISETKSQRDKKSRQSWIAFQVRADRRLRDFEMAPGKESYTVQNVQVRQSCIYIYATVMPARFLNWSSQMIIDCKKSYIGLSSTNYKCFSRTNCQFIKRFLILTRIRRYHALPALQNGQIALPNRTRILFLHVQRKAFEYDQ